MASGSAFIDARAAVVEVDVTELAGGAQDGGGSRPPPGALLEHTERIADVQVRYSAPLPVTQAVRAHESNASLVRRWRHAQTSGETRTIRVVG